jgi:glycosyltransferase involved in cell wall biosynthesis
VDVIKEYESQLNITHSTIHLLWSSEPDKGIYNAMNKGIEKASGEYLLFLNSGDYLVDERVVEKVVPLLDGTDIIQGNLYDVFIAPNRLRRGYGQSDVNLFEAYRCIILHPSVFTKRELFEQYGLFDESYRIISDTIFYFKSFCIGNASFKYMDVTISVFEGEGISENVKFLDLKNNEYHRFEKEYIPIRLYDASKNVPKKIKLYDDLKKNKIIWKMAMCLVKISNFL